MKRIILCVTGLMCVAMSYSATFAPWSDGNWSATGVGGTWGSNESGGWYWATNNPPGAADTVVLNGAKTVGLDVDATVSAMNVGQQNGGNGTLNVNTAGRTLAVANTTTVGGSTDIGTMNVSAGTVDARGAVSVNSAGSININGGTFGRQDSSGVNNSFNVTGGGTIKLQSGNFSVLGGGVTNLANMNGINIEVSGGALTFENQTWLGQTSATELKVVGDNASINLLALNQQGHTPNGIFNFVLDGTGVSTVNISAWMFLNSASVKVDGTAYSETVGDFITLFDSASINGELDAANLTVTGMGTEGVDWELVHDYGNTRVGISVIPEPTTTGLVAFTSLLVLVVRRFKM